MATAKSSSRKRSTSGSSNGSSPKAKSGTTRAKSGNGRSKSGTTRAKSARKPATRSAPAKQNASPSAGDRVGQAVGTAKQTASKVKGPALTAGAAAAGMAGGLLLKNRLRRPKLLGIPQPRSFDAKAVAKAVGDASQSFAKTSRTVSHDIERTANQAERLGRILGGDQSNESRRSPIEVVLDGLTHRRG